MAHFDLDLWVVQKDHHLGPVEITKKNSSVLFVISSWKKDPSRLIMRPLLFPR